MKKTFETKCKECKKVFVSRNVKNVFCSSACKTKNSRKNNIKEYLHKCLWCEKDFTTNYKKTKFCSHACIGFYKNTINISEAFCKSESCGKRFRQKNSKQLFCSIKCKRSYANKNISKVAMLCSFCKKEIYVPKYKINKQNNFYCSKKCESMDRESKANDVRTCQICKKEFSCKKGDKLFLCSNVCQHEWQKINASGKNHPSYNHNVSDEKRIKFCENCKKEMFLKPAEFYIKKYCSYSCKVKANPKSLTVPHKKVLSVLNDIFVECEAETQLGRYSLDCYLSQYNLGIEIMGTYWHCDIRIYEKPIDDIHLNSFSRDKKKQLLAIKSNLPILYIWEEDINKEYEMCKELIIEFINSNGMLDNYHSMNYVLEDGILKLRNEILVPHFEK